MENDRKVFLAELNAVANRLDAIKSAVKSALPLESCEGVGIGLLLEDIATRLRDLVEFGPKGAPSNG